MLERIKNRTSRRCLHHNSPVRRDTLIDFFHDLAASRGDFLVHDDGFRSRTHTYDEVGRAARAFAAACTRPACARATRSSSSARTVPSGSSPSGAVCSTASSWCRSTTARRPTFSRASAASSPRSWCWSGRMCCPLHDTAGAPVWKLHEIDWPASKTTKAEPGERRSTCSGPDQPRRHRRNHLHVGRDRGAQGRRHHPPERAREHRAGRTGDPEVPKVGTALLSAAVPEPAAAQPHVRPGDGDLHSADAARRRGLHARLQPRRDCRADQEPAGVGAGVACRRSSTCSASMSCGSAGPQTRGCPSTRRPVDTFSGDG